MEFKIVRTIDKLGRIVIPKDVRKSLGLNYGVNVEILVEDKSIIIRKADKHNSQQ